MLKIPEFETKKELHEFLIENKVTLMAQKFNTVKHADGVGNIHIKGNASKAQANGNEIDVSVVINTTNIYDSHEDVHFPKLWNKSLKENKRLMHVQEHQSNSFDKIISSGNDLKAYTKEFTWKELGYDMDGMTQALVFDSKVKKSRNSYMFDQYKDGYVDNHSVGMQYVKLLFCIDDKDYDTEYANWNKYYPEVVNKDDITNGFFWAVLEAKVIEGSAVPMGSNPITPTLNNKGEPSDGTHTEAEQSLQNNKGFFNNLI